MKDLHDIIVISLEGKKTFGIVVKHYDNPLSDFYIIYANKSLIEWHSEKEYTVLVDLAVLPAYDDALEDYRLKNQKLRSLKKMHKTIGLLMDSIKHNVDLSDLDIPEE